MVRAINRLLLLEPLAVELKRTAVFRDDAHELIGRSIGKTRLDLNRHRDLRANLTREMGDHFIRDPSSVTPDAT
jgi:hypothetical protein